MQTIKNTVYLLLSIIAFSGCSKVSNDNISFVQNGAAPSDFSVDVKVSLAGLATVTPSATGVATFNVYWGDGATGPTVIQPGKNGSHGYAEGSYTIKVAAKNLKGDSVVLTKAITVTTSQGLVDFETAATTFPASVFGGASFDKIANPHSSGINTSANVGKITKGSAGALSETWAGISIFPTSSFSFSSQGKVKMKVYSNHVGAIYKFKLENPSSGATTETDVLTTVANGWEELTFVMDPTVLGRSFGGFSVFYEFGLQGDGSANFVGLFDDVKILP